jgi:broad specificity phosphatase PhoE
VRTDLRNSGWADIRLQLLAAAERDRQRLPSAAAETASRWLRRSVTLLTVSLVYVVQHAEKRPDPGDPGLTERGGWQAAQTALWLSRVGLRAVYSSPLCRAWQTAVPIATAARLDVRRDERLRERMNWDGAEPIEDFLADWARCARDRDFVPRTGDSSRQAGARLHAFVQEQVEEPGAVAAITHGGATADLLRTLVGDDKVPADVVHHGVPSCAITILDGSRVVDVARTDHLA